MARVVLTDIKKSFGTVKVIAGISIAIDDGEFVALVGPSGCGKSTLLRIVAGLEDPDSGEISIGDQVVNDRLPKDRNIAMVFQSYALYPHMTVRQNMSFSLSLGKRPQSEIDQAVNEASEILGLNDYLDRLPKALSGGQRQRVAMGRAIVRKPQVFLFDEPLSNLDAKLRTVMRKEVKLLHQRLKTTSIYVTHDQTEAMTMADRIVVMNNGRIEQAGTPLELYQRPANIFVAGFIGAPQMNMLSGTVREEAGEKYLECAGVSIPLHNSANIRANDEIILGIRPEHLNVAKGNTALQATIEVIEPMGSETHLSCRIANQEIRLIEKADLTAKPGQILSLSFDASQVHMFSKLTGLRIL